MKVHHLHNLPQMCVMYIQSLLGFHSNFYCRGCSFHHNIMSGASKSLVLSSKQSFLKRKSRTYQKEIKCRKMNLPAWLLVIFSIDTGMCLVMGYNITFSLTTGPASPSCFAVVADRGDDILYVALTAQHFLFCILYPITGWLADTKIGRERAINLSLWSCWLGTLLQCISYCIQYGTCGLPVNIAKYGISGVALLLLIVGTAGLFTNIPAYGMDQLIDKSNSHVRAFIHWIVWGLYVGYMMGYIAFVEKTIYDAKLLLITGIVIFGFTSLGLCLHIGFYNYYELVGIQKNNPYKNLYNVLKYTWHHKSPERRSALTYWENKQPNRIDFGKESYGGPFSEEDVENVKTFWRIMAVLVSTFGFYIPCYHALIGLLTYMNSFEEATTTLNGYGSFALWKGFDSQIVLLVPILELIIIPFFPKIEYFLLNSLRGIGMSCILVLIALLSIIILDTVGHFITREDIQCATSSLDSSGNDIIQLSFLYYSIPLFFSCLADALSYIYTLQFICSQAPANMTGMLLGILWFLRALYINIGGLFSLWNIDGPGKISCSFWVLSVQIIICVVGMIVYVFVAKWYQKRRKDEDYDVHATVEAIYNRVLSTKKELSFEYTEETYS